MKLDATHLSTLATILRAGSFDAAAHQLGITQSAVSQRLKALETQVGARLVVRGQPCTGTAAGRRLAAHADQVALLESTLARDIAALAPTTRTPIRLAVNADSLATWFLAALSELPEHLFDLVIDDQDVSAEWLRRGEVMGAVTASARAVVGCDVVPLGALRYVATASPDFMARHFADGVTAQSIARAPVMRFDVKDQLQHRWVARYVGPGLAPPCHQIATSEGFVQAARLGIGWGMNPLPLVTEALSEGALVTLLPDSPLDTPLYWQSTRLLGPVTAPLTRAIRRAARAALHPHSDAS